MSSGEVPSGTGSEPTDSAGKVSTTSEDEHPVTGIVNRVYVPDANEQRAVLFDPSIKTVMLSIDCVRKLVDLHDQTARTYFREDQTVITTTTTYDEVLKELDWTRELDLIRQFGPDYHIPTEYSVYRTMSRDEQRRAIDDCMEGTEWFTKRLENHSTEILVQAKGWQDWHFRQCQPTMNRLDTNFVVFYATGYGNRIYDLIDDLNDLISALKPSGILIIGKQSTRFLKKAPSEVVAAAGTRWWRKPGQDEEGHVPKKHKWWKRIVEEELASGQSTLYSYE